MNKFGLTINQYSVIYVEYKDLHHLNPSGSLDNIVNIESEIKRINKMYEDIEELPGYAHPGIFFSFDDFVDKSVCPTNWIHNRRIECDTKHYFNGYIDSHNPYSLNTGGTIKYNKFYNSLYIVDYVCDLNSCGFDGNKCSKCEMFHKFMDYSTSFSNYHFNQQQSVSKVIYSNLSDLDSDCYTYVLQQYLFQPSKECIQPLTLIDVELKNKLVLQPITADTDVKYNIDKSEIDNTIELLKTQTEGTYVKEYNYKWSFVVKTYYKNGTTKVVIHPIEKYNQYTYTNYSTTGNYGFFIPFSSDIFIDYEYRSCYNYDRNDVRIFRMKNCKEEKMKEQIAAIQKVCISLRLHSFSSEVNTDGDDNKIFYQSEEVVIDQQVFDFYQTVNSFNSSF